MISDEGAAALAALKRQQAAVSPESLAFHLGLQALSVGSKRVTESPESDCRQVLAWWTVTVEPSFHPSLVVGAVHEEEWTSGPTPDRVTARGFVAGLAGAAVIPLDTDPVPDALGRMNPFGVEPAHRILWRLHSAGRETVSESWGEVRTLDGLAYSVRWATKAADGGQFRIANPRAGWPLEFERMLYEFARRVVLVADAVNLDPALACWLGYREEIATEPRATPDRGGSSH